MLYSKDFLGYFLAKKSELIEGDVPVSQNRSWSVSALGANMNIQYKKTRGCMKHCERQVLVYFSFSKPHFRVAASADNTCLSIG